MTFIFNRGLTFHLIEEEKTYNINSHYTQQILDPSDMSRPPGGGWWVVKTKNRV